MKKVIIKRSGRVLDVAPVIRETKTVVIAGHGKEQYRLKKPTRRRKEHAFARAVLEPGEYLYPTDKEVAEAEKELAEMKRKKAASQKAFEEREAKERADPRYELLQRFGHGADFEPWDKLTLEELQTIADIFDKYK